MKLATLSVLAGFCGSLLLPLPLQAVEAPLAPVLQRPALPVSNPQRAVLIDVTRAGQRLVAVGAQGLIVLSDDNGQSWRQAQVPVSVSLTAVDFPTARQGWATGHAGTVLHTADGGESWTLQLDGKAAAQRVLAAVPEAATNEPLHLQQLKVAQRLVAEGADKPLLALHFSDERHGTVVGAFGLILHTDDGGQSWQSWVDRLDNRSGHHLYAIASREGRMYIAGEQGLLLASQDNGVTFKRLQTPYEGSFFSMNLAPNGELLVAGLRGNAWRSVDQGRDWQQVQGDVGNALVSVQPLADGSLVALEQNGRLWRVARNETVFKRLSPLATAPGAALAQADDGGWIVVGARGISRLSAQGDKR